MDLADLTEEFLNFQTSSSSPIIISDNLNLSPSTSTISYSSYLSTKTMTTTKRPHKVQADDVSDVFSSHSRITIQLWATISQLLWWTVLIILCISIPILIHALYRMLTRFKKSAYFHFLVTMILLNLTMLVSILFNLMSDYVFTSLKGGRSFQ
jgi:hypothetical protein